MKKSTSTGSILIASTILYLLITLSVSFVLLNVAETNEARRHYHSTAAFWMAEAGINMFMKDTSILDESFSKTIPYGEGTIHLVRDDSKPMFRFITAIGQVGGIEKKIQISYPANVPEAYRNSLSTKGNIRLSGTKTSIIVNDKIRLSGELINTSKLGHALFEDMKSNQDSSLTSVNYSKNNTDTENNLKNFIQNNKDLITNYNANEILYIKSNDTYTLPTDGSLTGKKIIYIEGDSGGGDVIIHSNKAVAKDQNLTIITTGKVTFHQSGLQEPNSQLNIISWGGYNESVENSSSHSGLIYTHGIATFDQIKASSVNNGGIIADGGIVFGEIWSTKIFNYADMTENGIYPPGFEKFTGASIATTVSPYPVSWKEI